MDTTRARLGAAAALVVLLAGPAAASAHQPPADRHVARAPSAAAPTSLSLTGLATGPKPRIAYIRGTHLDFGVGDYTLRRPDGTTLRLPGHPWGEWAPLGRGAVGTFGTEAGPQVDVVAGTGGVRSSFVVHYGLAVSPDRSIVGWLLGRLNTPHVLEGGGRRSFDLPRIGHGLRIGTIAGAKTCKELPPEGGGCTVFVNTAGDRGVWVSASHGFVEKVGPMRSVTDIDQRSRVIGRTSDAHGKPCFALWRADLHRAWRTCRSRLVAFAPGGGHVVGLGPVDEKTGAVHAVTVYDDQGARVASYADPNGSGGSVLQVAWEDRTHLLATVFDNGRWAVVRLGLDGTAELATPVVKGRIDYLPYSLPLT